MTETKISIGYEPDFAPLTFIDKNQSRGLIIDILTESFERIGIGITFVPVPLQQHDAAIRAGAIDSVAFKAIVAERQRDYDFSIPIMTSGAAWFALGTESRTRMRSTASTRIATPAKGPLIVRLQRDYPEAEFLDVTTYNEALISVLNGDADCAALNFHTGCYLANRDYRGQFELPQQLFLETPLGLAFAKNRHTELCNRFNQILREMRTSRILESIEQRWITN